MASRTRAVGAPFDEKALREAPVRLASPSRCAREHAATLSRHYGVRVPPGEARGPRAAQAWRSLAGALSSRVSTTWASMPSGAGGSASRTSAPPRLPAIDSERRLGD